MTDNPCVYKNLRALAQLRSGVSFRTGVPRDPKGSTNILQAGDIAEDGVLVTDGLTKSTYTPSSSQLLKAGDIVIQGRGLSFRSAVVPDLERDTVAAAPLFVIHARTDHIDPSFISYFLNDAETQSRLRIAAKGTHVPQLSLSALSELEIPVPTIKRQRLITKAASLIVQDRKLSLEICDRRLALLRASVGSPSNAKPRKGGRDV